MASGVWRGTIARTDGARAYVTVPRLNRSHVYGPVDVLAGPWTPAAVTGAITGTPSTGAASAGTAHTHPIGAHTHEAGAPLAAGDRVLVAFIEGRADDLVILGRLP